jgi:hypothetical protein
LIGQDAVRWRRLNAKTLTGAFALAAACCRAAGQDRDAAVRAALGGVDWRRFERVVARHRVEGLAHEALRRAGAVLEPQVDQALGRAAAEIAFDGLRMAAEAVRLQRALDQAGIANLALKGATIDVLAWGRIGLKRAWDIDLLVDAGDAPRARAVLEAAGYDLRDPADSSDAAFAAWVGLAKESVFIHPGSGLVVELHWRLADAAGLLPGLSARSPAQTVRLSQALALRTLAGEELFAYLCVHGASHAWSRLKWLADLGALLAARDDAGRTALYRRALELGAGRCPASALLLCEALLGVPLPAGPAGEIRADRKALALADLALDAMTHGGGGTEIRDRPLFAERILLSHFLFADGWRYRWAEGSRQGVSLDDRMRLRLPPAFAFLYAPIRAPLWLWRRLKRGL